MLVEIVTNEKLRWKLLLTMMHEEAAKFPVPLLFPTKAELDLIILHSLKKRLFKVNYRTRPSKYKMMNLMLPTLYRENLAKHFKEKMDEHLCLTQQLQKDPTEEREV